MSELLTTRDIARKYEVSEYTITQIWVPRGLKHFPSRPFRFRVEWVEEYIERQAELAYKKRETPICTILKTPKLKNIPHTRSGGDMKIRMEDYFPKGVKKNA